MWVSRTLKMPLEQPLSRVAGGRERVPTGMLKTAKFWRAFTAATRAEAEKAAASWWAEQSGFDKISGWTLPAPDPGAGRRASTGR